MPSPARHRPPSPRLPRRPPRRRAGSARHARAPRFRIVDGIEVSIDGNPATLVDLSLVGAHVVSPTILKPNQRLRISLPDTTRAMRFSAAVAWASFEIPKGRRAALPRRDRVLRRRRGLGRHVHR